MLQYLRFTALFFFLTVVISPRVSAQSASPTSKELHWQFPLPRTHTGMLLGNGVQGLMIWGEDSQLNITIGRAGFWDHRGGNSFSASTTYQEVRRLLEAKDEAGLRERFAGPDKPEGSPERPYQIGGGRLEISFPAEWTLSRGTINLTEGLVTITLQNTSGQTQSLQIRQAVKDEFAWIELPPTLAEKATTTLVPSWEHVGEELSHLGVAPPETWNNNDKPTRQGFVQTLPDDAPLALGYTISDHRISIASDLGTDAKSQVIQKLNQENYSELSQQIQDWWASYWADVPKVTLPDPVLQEIYDGIYKQACVTPPHGVAASLQGPFNEEYRLPPWSNDYHFNINIEMIYWPALATSRAEHLQPMWDLLFSWMPQLQENGENFFETEGAVMLPHAVDDQGKVVGTFWTGTIDQACAAWMAQLAWLQYRYTMDASILRNTAWPLLTGAFNGYWGMIEEKPDGSFSLPVSVSPEFRGSQMNAWGENASFQLAALHMLAQILPQAAQVLDQPIDERWQQVSEKLPPYALVEGYTTLEYEGNKVQRIGLWDGMDLIQSHRHHSHLAAIYPFVSIDPFAEEHREIVNNSLRQWTMQGPGLWSGWCVPWAASLNVRVDQTEAAVNWLHFWRNTFVNEGRGTLHNAAFPGASLIYHPVWSKTDRPNQEIMQLDAGFGALTAVLELLVQNRTDGIHVFPSLHRDWRTASFDNVRAEGAFLISAEVEDNQVQQVRVKSLADGKLKIHPNLGEQWQVNGVAQSGPVLEYDCEVGEELILSR